MNLFTSTKNLQKLDQKGWILGPNEEEKPYFERIKTLKHFFSYPPEDVDRFLTDHDWSSALQRTHQLFDFAPDWIVAHYSDHKLPFFQGAATWIMQQNDIRIPLIQLKEKFESGRLLRLYKREEVLAHEAVHAVRMEFDEPFFEEFFAYETSPYAWRRFLGPLFQYPWEAYLFLLLLFIPLGLEIARFFYPYDEFLPLLIYLPIIFVSYLFLRLFFLHLTLRIALKRISKFLLLSERKWAVALRMKDREIFRFAYLPKKFLSNFLKKEKSLRWKLLRKSYFKKS